MKIAVIASHTPSHVLLRMDLMKDFIKNGHSVVALGPEPEEKWNSIFIESGIKYRQFFVKRNSINPLNDLKTYFQLCKLLKEEKDAYSDCKRRVPIVESNSSDKGTNWISNCLKEKRFLNK